MSFSDLEARLCHLFLHIIAIFLSFLHDSFHNVALSHWSCVNLSSLRDVLGRLGPISNLQILLSMHVLEGIKRQVFRVSVLFAYVRCIASLNSVILARIWAHTELGLIVFGLSLITFVTVYRCHWILRVRLPGLSLVRCLHLCATLRKVSALLALSFECH